MLLLIWALGLSSLALSAYLGAWYCPFERLTGLPGPLCEASSAIRLLLAGSVTSALATHATATLAALASLAAMPALLACRLSLRRGRWPIPVARYERVRVWICLGFTGLLLLQWSGTLWTTLAFR